MMSWHVVETLAQRESAVRLGLVRGGYGCWLPMCQSREDQPLVPLFPRYLFVELDGMLPPPRRDTNLGILGMVRFGDSLAMMTEADLAALRARVEPEPGRVLVLNPRRRFKNGETVRVCEGSWAGYEGLVRAASEERIRVLFDILGKNVVVDVASEFVRAVS